MFGVTQVVDTVTTRDNSFARFAVAVLEPELILKKMDVIIGNHFFELKFEVEPFDPNLGVRSLRDDMTHKEDDKGNDGDGDLQMKEVDDRVSQPSQASLGANQKQGWVYEQKR